MDLSISEEQTILSESVARFISNDYLFENRMQIAESNEYFSKEYWKTYAELGWTAVPFSEDDGGLGGGPVEIMLMMKEFGRGLVIEPFLANIILAGGILKRCASKEQKEKWLNKIIEGNLQAALAFNEKQSGFNVANISTTAKKENGNFVLNGEKSLVLNGGSAELIIIPARTSGKQDDIEGITLFAVPAEAKGIKKKNYKTVDAHSASEITLSNVNVTEDAIIGKIDNAYKALQDTIDDATLAVSAEAIGIMKSLHEKTVEYTKSRVQFGVPISSFQALQHRMVDTLMECEQSESLLLWSVMVYPEGDANMQKAISALKYQIGTAGKHVGQEAVQLHGAMGVTWELDVSHLFKRLTTIDILFGNADFHLDRFISLSKKS